MLDDEGVCTKQLSKYTLAYERTYTCEKILYHRSIPSIYLSIQLSVDRSDHGGYFEIIQ
jgi:hypothetical protein